MRRRVMAIILMVTMILAAQVATGQPGPTRGGTIRVGITQEVLNLDPHVATAFSSFQVLDLIYESLLRLNPQTLRLEPNLAESWTVSSDGLTYTFTLRRDAVFHDGTQVDATDVKYTIERILNPATKSPQASFLEPIKEVTVVNPFVVRITLKRPFAPFLFLLTGPGRGIVPLNFEEKVGDPRVKTLGSGPYRLERFTTGEVRLVRHDRYWRRDGQGNRLPYADAVIYRVIPDPATLRAALQAGDVDLIIGFGVDINTARALSGVAGLRIASTPDLSYSLLGINNERPPMNDVRVRQAMSMAVNRQQLAQIVYSGRAVPAGPIPPTAEEWNPIPAQRLPNSAYNPARSRDLLAQAGYPRGVTIKMMPIPTVPEAVQIAQVLKEQMAKAGFNVEIEQVDFATFLARWRGSQFDTFVSLNSGSIDPDIHLYRHIHSKGATNVFKFRDPTIDKLLDEARVTFDAKKRRQLYTQLQREIAEKVPFLFLLYADLFAISREQLQGFVLSPTRTMTPLAESWLAR
ncbi:MAG: ABC transporter substrate-binding protein [Armatimonadota bacterium]|nr:ABC transporter substrate-binding protein [Armatimonadota bacterium]